MSQLGDKASIRREIRMRRNALPDRDELSKRITGHLRHGQWLSDAHTICCYVSFRSEVQTHGLIRDLLDQDKRVCVPWCDGNRLTLTAIRSLNELSPGTMRILEPMPTIRQEPDRVIVPDKVDLYLVPGLAFTTGGARLGYGRGYYDKLLAEAPQAIRIGLAFQCQIVPSLPTAELDIDMHHVATEIRVFPM